MEGESLLGWFPKADLLAAPVRKGWVRRRFVTFVTAMRLLDLRILAKPRSGARMQPTAKAVGVRKERMEKPRRGGRILSHTSGNILLHFIFSTLGRHPLIKPVAFRGDLFAYLGGIVRVMQGTAIIINGTADHIHALVRIRPAQSAAEIARVMKANSSKWVRANWGSECLASRIRGLQCQRIECRVGHKIYRWAGGASQAAFVSRGVRRVFEKEQRGL
jgi:REP element-mobilizing transposase RayT